MPIKPTDMPPVEEPDDSDVIALFPANGKGRKFTMGKLRAEMRNRATHTGTQTASTISDFAEAASAAAPVQSVAGLQRGRAC